jgi:hypothetical protein
MPCSRSESKDRVAGRATARLLAGYRRIECSAWATSLATSGSVVISLAPSRPAGASARAARDDSHKTVTREAMLPANRQDVADFPCLAKALATGIDYSNNHAGFGDDGLYVTLKVCCRWTDPSEAGVGRSCGVLATRHAIIQCARLRRRGVGEGCLMTECVSEQPNWQMPSASPSGTLASRHPSAMRDDALRHDQVDRGEGAPRRPCRPSHAVCSSSRRRPRPSASARTDRPD